MRNIFLYLLAVLFLFSCENEFNYDLEGEYLDLDSIETAWYKEYPDVIIGGYRYKVYQNPTRKEGINISNLFRLEDKNGNNLFDQIDLSKTRIYEVVNGKEVMQYRKILYPNQSFNNEIHPLEPFYFWGKDWDDERIFDFYKSKGIHFYDFYGIGDYADSDFLDYLASIQGQTTKVRLNFYHQVTQNRGKYIVRWNDQWSDEIEIDFNWTRAKYLGKVGYMRYKGGVKKMWLNGKIVLDIDDDQYTKEFVSTVPVFGLSEGERFIDPSIDIVCIH